MIAYVLSAQDGDRYAYRWPGAIRCGTCGYVTDRSVVDPQLRGRRGVDVLTTYDNVIIVSARFAEVCRTHLDAGLTPLPRDPVWWLMRPPNVIPFDSARRGTRFERLCGQCGQFESVVGATPAFLTVAALPSGGAFFRTDLGFGSGDEKEPLVVVSPGAKALLERAGLSGLEFHAVEGAA